jgi:hypothetical protein
MSAIRLSGVPKPAEVAEAIDADEAQARAATARYREQFKEGSAAERCRLSLLLAASQRQEMDCRARRVARICSQRAESC